MAGGMEEATGEVVGATMGDTVTAMAITGDMDMVGGVILTGGAGGAIPTGGVPLTGGAILTIPIMIPSTVPTTILITMGVMGNRRCLQKGLALRQRQGSSNLLIGTSVRTRRVTTHMLKTARVAG